MEISKDSYGKLPVDNKLDILYDFLVDNKKDHDEIRASGARTEAKLNNRKKIDTTMAAFMGFVGGVTGFLAKSIFKI
jgi:hypothetical protein